MFGEEQYVLSVYEESTMVTHCIKDWVYICASVRMSRVMQQ